MSDIEMKTWAPLAEAVMKRLSKYDVEVRFGTSTSLSVKVRKGKLEELRRSGPSGAGLRLYAGKRSVSATTSELSIENLLKIASRLEDAVKLVDKDPANGLPDKELLFHGDAPDLQLYDPAVEKLSVEAAREMAINCEKAALAVDPKVLTNSSGAGVGRWSGFSAIFNSRGLAACRRTGAVSLSASPIAEDDKGNKKSGWWFHQSRFLNQLESPEQIGRMAGERTRRMLGAAPVKTGKYPVLFAPETANALLGHLFECVTGTAVYKNSTFLADKKGKPVTSELITIIDDPLLKRGLGSAFYDSEGVATSQRVLVEKGVLRYFPCDTFSARKLGMKSTGNSGRGMAGSGGVQSYNLHIANGTTSHDDMLKQAGTGLYVTGFIGFGFNAATGDFSRGAEGFWIENGKLVKPVHEVTVSGNLGQMLLDVTAVGDDLERRFETDSPTLLVKEMTVSGE